MLEYIGMDPGAVVPRSGLLELVGTRVPRIGYGTMRLTGPGVFGPPPDPAEARRVLRRALELGVRVFDTAWYYGPDIPNHRRPAVHHPEHRRVPPAQGIPQARREVTHPARTPHLLVGRGIQAAVRCLPPNGRAGADSGAAWPPGRAGSRPKRRGRWHPPGGTAVQTVRLAGPAAASAPA
jgi:hypothetical protein